MPEPDPIDALCAHVGWWLEVRCGCGRTAQIPVQLLVKRHGRLASLPALVSAMRCKDCVRRPPDSAALVDNPQSSAQGYVGGKPGLRRPVA